MKVSLLPAQYAFVHDEHREVLYSGAFGAGKSRALANFLVKRLVGKPGALGLLLRKDRTLLRQTMLRTLLQQDGPLPPVLPTGSYEHRKSEFTISLNGGGDIYYAGADDPAGTNVDVVAVDEGVELTSDQWAIILGRLRQSETSQLAVATNPGSPAQWLYERAYTEGQMAIHEANTLQNPYLPRAYVKSLQTLKGTAYQRYVLGRWVAHEGLIFGSLEVTDREGPWKHIIAGADAGYHHPAGVILGIPAYGRPHVIAEVRAENATEAEFAHALGLACARFRVSALYVDPSAPSLIAACQDLGLFAMEANNDVLAGISAVLQANPTISPDCVHLKRECLLYRWKVEGSDKPEKQDDHGPDALRYGLYTHALIGEIDMRVMVT